MLRSAPGTVPYAICYHIIGLLPMDVRMAFALEKCLHPNQPL